MWEIKKSLHTRDQQTAFVRCSLIGFQVELLFGNLHHMEMKDADLIKSIMNGTSKTRSFELTGLKLDNKSNMLSIDSLNVSDDSDQERLLKTIEALKAAMGDATPATVTTNAPRRLKGYDNYKFSKLAKTFFDEKDDFSEAGKKSYTVAIGYFIEITNDIRLGRIDHVTINNFKNTLSKMPTQCRKRFPNKSIKEVLKTDLSKYQLSTKQNVNKQIQKISTVMAWAVKQGYMNVNYAYGKTYSINEKEGVSRRRPFALAELQTIFKQSKIFQTNQHITDKDKVVFWVFLTALFTGARMNEICQLDVADVVYIDDILCFDINEKAYDKRLKNLSSARIVPVHSILIKIGFIDYLNSRKEAGKRKLFEIKYAKERENYSYYFTKSAMYYIRTVCGIKDKSVVFHSFRHNAADALSQNRSLKDSEVSEFLGHTPVGETRTTYAQQHKPETKQIVCECIAYDGLDLSHLYM